MNPRAAHSPSAPQHSPSAPQHSPSAPQNREDRGRTPGRHLAVPLIAILALGVPVLAGCTGQSDSSLPASQGITAEQAPEAGSLDAAGPADGGSAERAVPGPVSGTTTLDQRAIITTITTTVAVPDVLAATGKVIAAATQAGGYVQAQYTSGTDSARASSTITLRVPGKGVEQFTATVSDLGAVQSSERSSSDVTAEVADIDARLANAKAGVARLRVLMAQAKKISDIVAIESALSERQAEAESLAAQQRALADQTSLATITVVLVPTPEDPPSGFVGGLQNGWEAFTASLSSMSRLVGFLLPFLLLAGLLVLVVVLIVRRTGRRHPHGAVPPAPAQQQPMPQQPVAQQPGPGQ